MSTLKATAQVKQEIDRYRKFMLEHEYTPRTTAGYSAYLSRFLRLSPPDEMGSLQKSITDFRPSPYGSGMRAF